MASPGTTWLKSDVLKHPVLNTVAEKLGKTPAQVALRWGLQMGHSVLPKSVNESRIKENFDVFDWSIPEDLLTKFSEIEQASTSTASFSPAYSKALYIIILRSLLINKKKKKKVIGHSLLQIE